MDTNSDPTVLTAKVTLAQLEAMGCERFDIGVKRSEGNDATSGRVGRKAGSESDPMAQAREPLRRSYLRPPCGYPWAESGR